jgi:Glycosyl hydrolases family 28
MIKSILLSAGLLLLLSTSPAQTAKDSIAGSGFNILRYGAKPDGTTNNTAAIQMAVNDCHRNGGGKIIVPAGNFITGTIRLCSNIDIELEAGSVLSGSLDDKDYLYQKDIGFTGPGAGTRTGIFVAHNEQNISITGSGSINGNGRHSMYMDSLQQGDNLNAKYTRQGRDYMNQKYGHEDGPVMWKGSYENRPGVMVIFSGCKNIRLNNINLKESPNWTVAFLNSEDIKISGITIDNNMNIPNSDGIDFYDSKNITISDCLIQAGDDAIAVVSSSNITATNCILHSRSCGIRVGYNVFNNNNSGNLLFNNIRIYDSNRGIGIFQRRQGNMENMIFSNIIIGTRLHSGQWWGHGEPIHISSIPGLGGKETGTISNVRFSNITATSESGVVIYGSAEGLIHDIYFENVNLTLNKSPLEEGYGGNIDLRPVNDLALGIFSHDIPALYSTFADNLEIRNMHVTWGSGLPAYFKHDVDCANFNSLTIDGLHEEIPEGSPAENSSIVFLHKSGITHIRELSSTNKKRKFILKSEND